MIRGWDPASVPAEVVLLCCVMIASSQDHASCIITLYCLFDQVSTAFCYAHWAGSDVALIRTFVLCIGNGSFVEIVQTY